MRLRDHRKARRPTVRPLWTLFVAATAALSVASCGPSADTGSPAGTGGGHHGGSASGTGDKVVTKLLSFEPEKLTVPVGTTVTWEVGDSIAHTVTTGTFTLDGDGLRSEEEPDGKVDKPLAPGEPVSFTFDEPGTYKYFCTIHRGMNGEVEVTP
jgi:plastocyanin